MSEQGRTDCRSEAEMDFMFTMIAVLFLGFLVFVAVGAALGFAANAGRGRLAAQVTDLAARVAALEGGAPRAAPAAVPAAPEAEPAAPEVEPIEPEIEPTEAAAPEAEPASPAPLPWPPAPAPRRSRPRFEESLTSRWLVWVGGVALALAAAFLVKYSIDQGWMPPAVRCTLGFAFGLALVGGGEYLRRHPLGQAVVGLRRDAVPAALTAAGLFAAFASVYAAYALYGLVGSGVAFGLLAATAFAGFALAYVQGPPIAVLGLLGSLATPLIVATIQPLSWALFPYLFAVVAVALTLVRFMRWWWLAFGGLAGAVLWTWFWMSRIWLPGDAVPVGLFIVALAALYLFVRPSVQMPAAKPATLRGYALADIVAWSGGIAAAILAYALVRMAGYNDASLVLAALLVVVFLTASYRDAGLDRFAIVAATLVIALIATWHLPRIVIENSFLYIVEGRRYGGPLDLILVPQFMRFIAVSTAFGVAFALAGFVSLWRAQRPVVWAGVSAAVPVLLFAIAYWRLTAFAVDPGWAAVALGLALAAVAAVTALRARWQRDGGDVLVAVYAAAAVAAVSLGAGMLLEQAWLSVALAAQLPALAWIQSRLEIETLRPVAMVVAAAVLVRLALNPYILDYPLGAAGLVNWILYGYGLPAVLFFAAARRFRATVDDGLVRLLEAGALVFTVLLVSFEIRHFVAGPLGTADYGLLEQSLHSIAWLMIALFLSMRFRASGRPVALYGARLMAGLGVAQVVLLQVLLDNPYLSGAAVAGPAVFNTLILAYAAPAALFFLLARERAVLPRLSSVFNAGGFMLVSLFLTLEVRHLFQGPVLSLPGVIDAELYTYSAVWLVYALALLGLGYVTGLRALRHAALLVILATVGKVFLIDMAGLTGLYRVLSFLGLGLVLVGIGYFYQRFVLLTPPAPETISNSGTEESA